MARTKRERERERVREKKVNGTSHLSRLPRRGLGESQGEQKPYLGEKKENRSGRWTGKSGFHSKVRHVPSRKKGQTKRIFRGEIRKVWAGKCTQRLSSRICRDLVKSGQT